MRIQEFISADEWQHLQRLVFDGTWHALSTYQQQRANQMRLATKPAATLKPQAAKTAKSLARKAKRPPHAAPPRPLPKAKPQQTVATSSKAAYQPVKGAAQLPPTTKSVAARSQPKAPPAVTDPNHIDQATRRWLPKNKQGMNPIDLLSLDERG